MRSLTATRIGHAAMVASSLLLVACRDDAASSPNVARARRVAPRTEAGATHLDAKARIHQRNRHDWIGVAHNRALDDFRKQLRAPGILTKNLCDFVTDFSSRPERLPVHLDNRLNLQESTRGHVKATTCGQRVSIGQNPFATLVGLFRRKRVQEVSAATSQLIAEVESAVDASTTSSELAGRLESVLDAAAALDTTDQGVVSAAVSVAQNSFEYWETNFSAFQQEIVNEYMPCANSLAESGYSLDDAGQRCMEGGSTAYGTVSLRHPTRPDGAAPMTGRTTRECGWNAPWKGIIRMARADLDGGVRGFWGGLVATRSLIGALTGALGGAAAGSLYEGAKVTWEIIVCAY